MIGYGDLLSSENDSDDENSEPYLFIRHLRKCFIAIDDNSCCESSLLPDLRIFNRITHENRSNNGHLHDDALRAILSKRIDAESYEYASILKSKSNRRNSIKSLPKQEKTKSVEANMNLKFPWSNAKETEPHAREALFQCKEAPDVSKISQFKSALTELLLNESIETNDFLSYIEFEAIVQDSNKVQNLRIFLPMCDKNDQERTSMTISIYKTAKISDLIGLICCKYTNEKILPNLKFKSVNDYFLKIAEESGEIELELSSLDSNNYVGKFGFTHLALIEKVKNKNDSQSSNSAIKNKAKILIHFTDNSPDEILTYDSENIKMKIIFEDLCKLRDQSTAIFCPLITYRLEHIDEPGIFVELDDSLNSFKKYEFFFFRQNSIRTSSLSKKSESSSPASETDLIDKLMLENVEFNVVYLSKWSKVAFKIELSIDSIILEEIKTSHLSLSQKKVSNFYSISIKNVCACIYLLTKEKSALKSHIRIVVAECNDDSCAYKHLDFECDLKVAKDINMAISHLIVYCDSSIAKAYDSSLNKTTTKWSRKLYN